MTLLVLTLLALQAAASSLPAHAPLSARQEPAAGGGDNKNMSVVECVIKHEKNILQGSFLPRLTMAVGTPPQEFSALLDTGSGDLLVGKAGSTFCSVEGANCTAIADGGRGSFSTNASAAELETIGPLKAPYFNGELNLGEFKRADAVVGGVTVAGLQFGLVDELNQTRPGTPSAPLTPLLGVGPIIGETEFTTTYNNLPARMRELGTIKSNIFGVYLNDWRGSDGSLVFGGVDVAKFTGELQEAPLVPRQENNKTSFFLVDFSSLKLVNTTQDKPPAEAGSRRAVDTTSEHTLQGREAMTMADCGVNLAPAAGFPPAFIDTGNPTILIPGSSVDMIAKSVGANLTDGFIGPVACDALQGKSLRFGFNKDKVLMDVPLEMTVVPNEIAPLDPGLCATVIGPSANLPSGFNLASLGAPMMQSMYIAFDIERNRLLFAPAVMNATQSDIRELDAAWTGTISGTGGKSA